MRFRIAATKATQNHQAMQMVAVAKLRRALWLA